MDPKFAKDHSQFQSEQYLSNDVFEETVSLCQRVISITVNQRETHKNGTIILSGNSYIVRIFETNRLIYLTILMILVR